MNGFNGLRQAQAERNLLYRAISKALLVRQCLYAFTSADDAVAALPFLLSNHVAHLNGEMHMNYKRRLSEVLTAASRDVSVQPDISRATSATTGSARINIQTTKKACQPSSMPDKSEKKNSTFCF
jgi:hypothetical protein